jgi:NADPH:quinone reductase-like Zn-dependent oxidoreductase
MKAILVHQYGGPEVLQYETTKDPVLQAGEVLVQVSATSVNPFDVKQRSGFYKEHAPLTFPAILGLDISGTIVKIGPGVNNWKIGDLVFAQASKTYAELRTVKAENLVKIPQGLNMQLAAALPTVLTTGGTLVTKGTNILSGQTILVTGAVGNVGRVAVFSAKERGAVVIAGVRKEQLKEAASLGADEVIAIDDEESFYNIPMLDAVADTVGGQTAEKLMAKVKKSGNFSSVLRAPANAKDYPDVKVVEVYGQPDAKMLLSLTQAVVDGKLLMPTTVKFPLKEAQQAHEAFEKGSVGKVLLIVD